MKKRGLQLFGFDIIQTQTVCVNGKDSIILILGFWLAYFTFPCAVIKSSQHFVYLQSLLHRS